MDLDWHNMSKRFESVSDLKARIFMSILGQILIFKWDAGGTRSDGLCELKIWRICIMLFMKETQLNYGVMEKKVMIVANEKMTK